MFALLISKLHLSYVFKFFLPSYIFQILNKFYRVSNSCSNVLISMTLFEKKKKDNAKVLTYALDNSRIIFVIL